MSTARKLDEAARKGVIRMEPSTDLCACCAVEVAHPDDRDGLCNGCRTEIQMDRAELDAEDCRVGLCAHQKCGRD